MDMKNCDVIYIASDDNSDNELLLAAADCWKQLMGVTACKAKIILQAS